MADTKDIGEFLANVRDSGPPDLQHYFINFEDLWERSLWHQLTDALITFFDDDASEPIRLPLYKKFVLSFAKKINQLKLVKVALSTASAIENLTERLAFLQTVADKVNSKDSQDAYVYALVSVATVKLEMKDLTGAREELDKAEKILDGFDSVEPVVNAEFYKVNASYFQAKLDFAPYYKNALLYLACINLDDLDKTERRVRAYDVSLAALVSTTIYNFGELLLHPILQSFEKDDEWLVNLLFAFNRGDLAAYEALSGRIAQHGLLNKHQQGLREKIYLSSLTEAVFRRPPHDRAMSFATIAAETRVSPDEIEHLIMRALSLGLLKGSIDQVDEVAKINWVQPKVLDMKQIQGMRERLQEWDSSVNQLGNWIEKQGQDLWAV